jgi:hypothetical protein
VAGFQTFLSGRISTFGDIVDESGEDYLFSADRFVSIDIPGAVKASLLKA